MTQANFSALRKSLLALFLFVCAAPAQILPANAHVNLYFPQIVDGGTEAQQWQTTINFTNPNDWPATVSLTFFASSGGPLNLDFGNGPSGTLSVVIPPDGSQTVGTKLASDQIISGWAFGDASVPVLATLTFTQIVDGTPRVSVSAPPTVPGHNYLYPANYFLSVAVANPFTYRTVSVLMTLRDSSGTVVAGDLLILPPNGHTAFTLWQRFPGLDSSFQGSLRLSPNSIEDFTEYLAWGMGSDSSGVISGLPSGQFTSPKNQWDEIWLAFRTLLPHAEPFIGPQPVNLSIGFAPTVNAWARNGDSVLVTLGLAELLADSPSELAFVIGHELGHIYQQRNGGQQLFRPDNTEADADLWGLLFSLGAGYDPYAIAGSLAKLAMATDSANLSGQLFEDLTAFEAHKSFSTRIAEMFDTLQVACVVDIPDLCNTTKTLLHPHLPSSAPLMEIIRESSERRRDW